MPEQRPDLINPFDAAYLGLEYGDEPSTSRITIRLPKRWLEMATQFAQDPRLPFNHSISAVMRAAVMRYLYELASDHGEAEIMMYLQSANQLRHAAFKQSVEFESKRHIVSFESALGTAVKRKRLAALNDTLAELRAMIDRTHSDEWRGDLEIIVAGSEPIKRALRFLIGEWAKSPQEANQRRAQEWQHWLTHLEGVLYG